MANQHIDYECYRGEDWTLNLTFKNKSTGLPIDITGWTIFFTEKKRLTDPDTALTNIVKNVSVLASALATAGQTSIVITDSDTEGKTGILPFSITYKTADGIAINKVIVSGNFKVEEHATIRKSAS